MLLGTASGNLLIRVVAAHVSVRESENIFTDSEFNDRTVSYVLKEIVMGEFECKNTQATQESKRNTHCFTIAPHRLQL
jgi:hypothetical protein